MAGEEASEESFPEYPSDWEVVLRVIALLPDRERDWTTGKAMSVSIT
jgi:hypothetical protein